MLTLWFEAVEGFPPISTKQIRLLCFGLRFLVGEGPYLSYTMVKKGGAYHGGRKEESKQVVVHDS